MARHEVVIHENKGATKGVAPYTGVYIAKETVRQDGFMGYIAAKSGLPAVQAQAILEGAFEAVEELEKESLVRIHTDLGTICGVITGSFETADAAFDPEKNSLELALRLEDAIRLSLADVVPTIVADENLTKVRVDNVMDLVTPRPYNLIHGQNVYRVAGFNMVHEDEGATVFLQDAKGVTYEVVVDRVVSKQLFEAHTAELLEAGDYKLVVKSRAGDAEGPLQTAFRRVKYLKVEAPAKPRVAFGRLTMVSDHYVEFSVENAEGVKGYRTDESGRATVPFSYKLPDKMWKEAEAVESEYGSLTCTIEDDLNPYINMHAQVRLTPDPAKADRYDQTPAVIDVVIEP